MDTSPRTRFRANPQHGRKDDGLEREVNAQVMEPAEWCRRVQAGDHFLGQVMKGPKRFAIGDQNELERLYDPSATGRQP